MTTTEEEGASPEFDAWHEPVPSWWFLGSHRYPVLPVEGLPIEGTWSRFYGRPVAETIPAASEAIASFSTHPRTIAVTVTPSDAINRIDTLFRTIADTAPASDGIASFASHPRTIAVTVTPSDAVVRVDSLFRTIAETVTPSDAVVRVDTLPRTISESLGSITDGATATILPFGGMVMPAVREMIGDNRPRPSVLKRDAQAMWLANQYSGAGSLLDRTGRGHDLALPGGSANPTFLAYVGGSKYVRLPGSAGNFMSVPDAAALDIVGDIDLRVQVAMDDWTPAAATVLLAKWTTTGNQLSWRLRVETSGVISLGISTDGSTTVSVSSSVAPTVTDGATLWIRATWVDSTNLANFYTSSDGVTWSQLGTADRSLASVGIFSSSANVEIGSSDVGTTSLLAGNVYRAQVLQGVAGTSALDVAPTAATATPATTTFTAISGQTVTIVQSGNDKARVVDPRYAYLPGVVGNTLSTPDAAALDITDDLAIAFDGALDDWTPAATCTLVAKFETSGNQRSYSLQVVATTGVLRLVLSTDGTATTNNDSSAAPVVADGAALAVGVTRRKSDGRIQFWTAATGTRTAPGGTGWTQLGTNVTGTTSSLFSGSALGEIGGQATATANLMFGKVYDARIYSAIDGTGKVLDVEVSRAVPAATTFTAITGQTVTINRSASDRKTVIVDRSLFLFGADDYLTTPDTNDLDFALTDSFTIVAAVRAYGSPSGNDALISKKNTGGISAGWELYRFSAAGVALVLGDGTNNGSGNVSVFADGVATVAVGVRDAVAHLITVYTQATAGTPASDSFLAATLANAEALRIGSNSTTDFADMEFIGAAVFRRALSASEIALVGAELLAA